jgi:hypothetical protein
VPISVDGNSIVITNCTVTVDNAFDPTTGVATITITPTGGLGTLPALVDGQSGPSPQLRNLNLTQVPYGTALPNPAGSFTTIVPPGSPGVSAVYDMNISLNSGAPGSLSAYTLSGASDISGSPAAKNVITRNSSNNGFVYSPRLVGPLGWASSYNDTSGTGAGPRTLTQLTIPAQTFAYYPICIGSTVVNGTANTQVNLQAYVGSTAGNLVGIGFGVAGVPAQTVILQPGIPAGSNGTYGQVASGSTATLIFAATQVASTVDAWSTSKNTTSFLVFGLAVQP